MIENNLMKNGEQKDVLSIYSERNYTAQYLVIINKMNGETMKKSILFILVSILAFGNLYGQISVTASAGDKEKTMHLTKPDSSSKIITAHTAYLNDGTKVNGKMKGSFSIGFSNPFKAEFSFISDDGETVEVKNIDRIEKNDGNVLGKSSLRMMHYTSIVIETVLLAGLIYIVVVL